MAARHSQAQKSELISNAACLSRRVGGLAPHANQRLRPGRIPKAPTLLLLGAGQVPKSGIQHQACSLPTAGITRHASTRI